MPYGLIGKSSSVKILKPFPARFGVKILIEKPRGFAVGFENPFAKIGHTVVKSILGHCHSRALSQILNRVDIIEVFNLHYKGDYVSAHSAAEAVERTVFGIDIKRRCLFAVERTQSDHISAAAFEINIRRRYLCHIAAVLELL